MKKQSVTWTEKDWITFGNRVKNVREHLFDLMRDAQSVSTAADMNAINQVVSRLDRWKARMESKTCRTVRPHLITRIFYGETIDIADDHLNPISGN